MNQPLHNLQDLPTVRVDVPVTPDVRQPSLPMIGYHLSRLVLGMIGGCILFLAVFLFTRPAGATSALTAAAVHLNDSAYARHIDLVRMWQEEQKNDRAFFLQVAQMVLLNLLLPVLTAILGYIFAASRTRE